MGITCADVGGYVSSTEASGYVAGLAPCTDSRSIVGYVPSNNVQQHLRLDLDQRNLSVAAVAPVDLVAAYKAYSVGK